MGGSLVIPLSPPRRPRRAWAVGGCVLMVACVSGCDRDATKPPAATAPATAPAATRPFAVPVGTPFTGVIKASRHEGPLPVGEVTYTVGRDKIRREYLDRSDVVTRHLARTPPLSGVIADLPAGRVILYRTYLEERHFVEIPLDQYERDLRPPPGTSRATNQPDAVEVNGLRCDLLRVEPPPAGIEVSHCRAIIVDRRLLRLVEPDLPADVIGFPLAVRVNDTTTGVADMSEAAQDAGAALRPRPSRVERLAGDALRATTRAATRAARALDVRTDVIEIAEGAPPADAFDPPPGFARCTDLAELNRKTTPSGVGFD